MLGGIVGNMTMAVLGQPSFAVKDRVMLFLKPHFEQQDIPFVGANEGKFAVLVDPATGAELLHNEHRTLPKVEAEVSIRRVMAALRTATERSGKEDAP
jgi:hypothetical protein